MKSKLFFSILCVACFCASCFGQFKLNDFIIRKSSFQNDLKEIKAANPNLTNEELVKVANELIQNKGVNFVFGLDAATCQKITVAKANQKDKTKPLNLRAGLTSVGGDGNPVSLMLPEASFEKNQCFPCFVQMPVFEITNTDFVSSIMGTNIKFVLPQNFLTNQIQLVDQEDSAKVLKNWKIPFLSEPISISDDGNIIFLGFTEPELNDLTLMAFGEGTFLVGAKKDIPEGQKIEKIEPKSTDTAGSNFELIKIINGESSKTVKYKKICNN